MKKLLLIYPGPTLEVGEKIMTRITRLSERYQGLVLSSMSAPKTMTIGNFQFRAAKYHWKLKPINIFTFSAWTLLQVAKSRLRGEKWDLVISYDPIKSGVLAALAAALSGAKFAPEVNGVYDSKANYLDQPSPFQSWLRRKGYTAIIRFVLGRADGVKLLFPSQIDGFKSSFRKSPVIHAFFNLVAFDQMKNLEEKREILFVGFPFKRKGVDILIEAFKMVAQKHPDWKLKILGWFKDKAQLDRAIGGHPQIYHHPPVYPREMPEHIGRCAFLVLPSRSEAMGRVLLEAMAAAKPRIGANVDGIPMVVKDGVDGLLFAAGDPADLAAKLDLLMGDAALRARLGANAKRRVEEEFNADRYFENLFHFYDSVIGRG